MGDGALFAVATGKGILAHRETDGALHTYVAISKPQGWIAGIDFANPKVAKARVAEEFEGWAPELTALITNTETAIPRTINALPIEHRWQRVPGVTLLGDVSQPRGHGQGWVACKQDGVGSGSGELAAARQVGKL